MASLAKEVAAEVRYKRGVKMVKVYPYSWRCLMRVHVPMLRNVSVLAVLFACATVFTTPAPGAAQEADCLVIVDGGDACVVCAEGNCAAWACNIDGEDSWGGVCVY